MKTLAATVAGPLALLAAIFLTGCETADAPRIATLPTARPIPLFEVGGPKDGRPGHLDSTPAIDAWQAKNHADIVGDPTPIIRNGRLTGWVVRWVPSPNPYLLHFAYSSMSVAFSLVNGVSTQDVLNKLWEWRAATLGFAGRPVFLNYTASPLTVHTFALGGATDQRDALNVTQLRSDMDQESQADGFWYLYHDPAFTLELDALHLTVPPGYPTAAAYLEHRAQLEVVATPALKFQNGQPEFAAKLPAAGDKALMMERFVVQSDWLDVQPFSRVQGGPVVMVKIINVTAGTPLDKAGVKAGAILTSYQHQPLAGLTEDEFKRIMRAPISSDIRLEVAESPQDRRPREIVIPLASLEHKPAPPGSGNP